MPFRLRRDCRNWFGHVAGDLPLDFDMYYLCLMAGFKAGRKADVGQATELVDNFPGDYRSGGRILAAMLLRAELHEAQIDLCEREPVHKLISGLLDTLSPSGLSTEGVKLMNRYASGGFEELTERFEDKPRFIDVFLLRYKQILDRMVDAPGPG